MGLLGAIGSAAKGALGAVSKGTGAIGGAVSGLGGSKSPSGGGGGGVLGQIASTLPNPQAERQVAAKPYEKVMTSRRGPRRSFGGRR
jgi:hypothetical protein